MKLELVGDKQKNPPRIDSLEKYTEARIWHCNYSTLSFLQEFVNLESLTIASFPDDNIVYLSQLQSLERLYILHLPKLKSISPISELKRLKYLELSTLPGWDASGKISTLDSIEPLASLPELQELRLAGINFEAGTLDALARCATLKIVHTGNLFTIEEFARLSASRPDIAGLFLRPYIQVPHNSCGKCGAQRIMLSGVLKYAIKCPECHARRVREHVQAWQAFGAG